MKTYRVGVVGLGRMGSYIDDQQANRDLPYSIANSTLASQRLELAAGCDVLEERRNCFSERY